jgi:hypothetical protein
LGQPQWCTATPEDASAPFCQEVCDACGPEATPQGRWEASCRAHCRAAVGIDELACEQLDADVEQAYRECLATSDRPGCGGWTHPIRGDLSSY